MSPQDEEKVGVWNFSKDDCILVEDAIYGLNAPTGKTGDAQKSRQEFKKLDSQSELDRIAKLLKGKAVGCTMRVDNVAYQYTMRDGVKTLVKKPDRGLKFSIAVSRERLPLLLLETKALGEQKWKKKREICHKNPSGATSRITASRPAPLSRSTSSRFSKTSSLNKPSNTDFSSLHRICWIIRNH